MESIQGETVQNIKKFFTTVFDTTVDSMILMTLEGIILEVNEVILKTKRILRTEIVGLYVWEAFLWSKSKDQQILLKDMVQRAAAGETIKQHINFVNDKEEVTTIDFSVRSIKDENGQVVALLSQSRDVSNIRQIERDLREAEERFRKSFVNAGIGMVVVSSEGRFLEVNPAFCNMLGYSEAELLQLSVLDVTHPDEKIFSQAYLTNAVANKESEKLQLDRRCIHKDGHTIWVKLYIVIIRDKNLQYKYAIVHVQDYSDQIRTERALKENEVRYKELIESLEEGVMLSSGKEIIAFNESAKRILSLSDEDLKNPEGIDPDWYLTQEDGTRLLPEEEPIVVASQTGKSQRGILIGVHKPNNEFTWISANVKPLFQLGEEPPYSVVGSFRDVTKLKEQEEKLTYQAFHDSLTQLPNRALFFDRLEQAINNISRDQGPHAILYMDLDRFKYVNDTFGHDIGDKLLIEVAKRLNDIVRSGDTVARLSGDEFALLLVNIKLLHNMLTFIKRIQACIRQPYTINNHILNIDLSIGIALTTAESSNGEVLLRNADSALRQAKQNGKGQYVIFDQKVAAKEKVCLLLEQDLRNALKQNELRVFYQPIFSVSQQKIIGAEALMRWEHPERGLVSPVDFISLAEDTGLIIPMGKWLVKESLRQLKVWLEEGMPIYLSLNISARQLQDEDLVLFFRNILTEYSVVSNFITLELTESLVMDRVKEHGKRLQELADLGFTITIDDFGTGYSSLGYLKHLPVTELKIDRSFLRGVPDNEADTNLVAAVFSLARQLNLSVVAEGVESVNQLKLLKQQGCEKAQGYYFGKPMPPAEFKKVVKD